MIEREIHENKFRNLNLLIGKTPYLVPGSYWNPKKSWHLGLGWVLKKPKIQTQIQTQKTQKTQDPDPKYQIFWV